jgi:hypothetical protein
MQIYAEVLRTYEHDPLANLVSPPLTASTGVIPLSIISVYVCLAPTPEAEAHVSFQHT